MRSRRQDEARISTIKGIYIVLSVTNRIYKLDGYVLFCYNHQQAIYSTVTHTQVTANTEGIHRETLNTGADG